MRFAPLAAAALLAVALPAVAQQVPGDLTVLPAVPSSYQPQRTQWGDPDLRGVFTLDTLSNSRVAFERPDAFGNRFWVTDAEFAQRLEAARKSDAASSGDNTRGTKGLEAWMKAEPFARRTSMLVSPESGKLPPLTPAAEALRKAGRSSWVPGGTFDWVDDFDTWDRCISRGFPASMMPFRYNNGVRIFQAPGYVAIHFEMLGDRIIPLRRAEHWPAAVESWMGSSLGHWEGRTLVVETTNIKTGDDARATCRAAPPRRSMWPPASSPTTRFPSAPRHEWSSGSRPQGPAS